MTDGVDGFDDLRLRPQAIEQPAHGDGMRHGDRGPQDAAVTADPGNGVRELRRRNRSNLTGGLDPRRGETGVVEADGGLATRLPSQQQQPGCRATGDRIA